MLKKMFTPKKVFAPKKQEVKVLPNIQQLFQTARAITSITDIQNLQEINNFKVGILSNAKHFQPGQKHLTIITPDRMILLIPAPAPNSISEDKKGHMREFLPPGENLQITVIAYNNLEALNQDKRKLNTIPFLGHLLGIAYQGHDVVIFEGDKSAFRTGVDNSDVVLIDEAMLPFLPENWAAILFEVIKPKAKVYIHVREKYKLMPITKKNTPPGWRYTEFDNPMSYTNMLLTTISKKAGREIKLIEGQPVPELHLIADNPEEIDYLESINFSYDRFLTTLIIDIIIDFSKNTKFTKRIDDDTWIFSAKLAEENKKMRDVSLQITKSKNDEGYHTLTIKSVE